MHLRSLSLRNYRVYRELDLEFPDGLVGIYGPNGSGKSTLIESIRYALYGDSRTDKAELRSAGVREDLRVELVFEHEGNTYDVRRRLKGLNLTPEVEVYRNGQLAVQSVREANAFVGRVLGMDQRAFLASVCAQQKELTAFTGMVPSERRRLVLDLLGVSPVERALAKVREEARGARDRAGGARAQLPDLPAAEAEAAEAAAELAAAESAEQAAATAEQAARAAQDDAEAALAEAEQAAAALAELRNQARLARAAAAAAKGEAERHEARAAAAAALDPEIEAAAPSTTPASGSGSPATCSPTPGGTRPRPRSWSRRGRRPRPPSRCWKVSWRRPGSTTTRSAASWAGRRRGWRRPARRPRPAPAWTLARRAPPAASRSGTATPRCAATATSSWTRPGPPTPRRPPPSTRPRRPGWPWPPAAATSPAS